ncbi:dihydroxyacetone kinase subunit DhaK, partial [Nguyenibacter vanlangensis]
GADLPSLVRLCREVNANVRSMGAALTPCTVPQSGRPSFELAGNEIEFGIGIHGEPGRRRIPLESADRIAEMLMAPILADLPFRRNDPVLLFVNGLGGTPLIELYIVYRAAHRIAAAHGLQIVRSLVGSYITSLEMAGTSITLLRLTEDMLRHWDAPCLTPALRWGA